MIEYVIKFIYKLYLFGALQFVTLNEPKQTFHDTRRILRRSV